MHLLPWEGSLPDIVSQHRQAIAQSWLASVHARSTAPQLALDELRGLALEFLDELTSRSRILPERDAHHQPVGLLTSPLIAPQGLELWSHASLTALVDCMKATVARMHPNRPSRGHDEWSCLMMELLVKANRRLAEERQVREQSQAVLIEKMSDSFIVLDASWRYTYINDAGGSILKSHGYDAPQLIGQCVWEVLPYLESTSFGQAFRRVFANRLEENVSDYYAPTSVYFRASVFPTREGGIAAIISEVPMTEAAQKALSAQERRFESIFETATSGMAVVDEHGKIIRVNRRFTTLLGYDISDLMQLSFRDFTYAADIAKEDVLFAELVSGKRAEYELEKRYVCKDGRVVWVLLNVAILYGDEGKAEAYIGSVMDISTLKATEMALLTADRAKDEFLAILSHELRTPLNAILGCTELLGFVDHGSQEQHEAIETIQRNVEAEARIVDDILDVSRIITGKLPLNIEPYQLTEVITAAVSAVHFAMHSKAISFTSTLDKHLPAMLGDRNRIQQVVWNLLSNAIKFTPSGGSVHMTAVTEGDSVTLQVKDSGAGITADFLPDVFLRFRQQDSSPSRSYQGLGLGLSIVKQIVEAHGGTVSAASAGSGRGATFTVMLPVKSKASLHTPTVYRYDKAVPSAAAHVAAPTEKKRILVVDDHKDAVRLNTLVLRQFGFDVIGAHSGMQALAFIAEGEQFDLILSDISMPHMDGYQLLKDVRALEVAQGRPPMAAIALSAFVSKADRQRSLAAGFIEHLAKPLKSADLLATLTEALAKT